MKKTFTSFLVLFLFLGISSAQDKKACLQFDGSNDKVVVPHHSSLNLGRSAFTIEAWITASPNMKLNAVLAPTIISKKGASSPSNDGMLFGLTDQGKLAIQIEGLSLTPGFGGFGTGVAAIDLRDDFCHHIAWTREVGGVEDTVNGYQDGAYVRKTRLPAQKKDISNALDLWIGGSDFNTNPNIYWFEGQIKEIRIWNYARTESQIWADKNDHLVGNEPGLIFYWRMNENGLSPIFGDTVYDCGPSHRHGVIDGASWTNFSCDNMSAIPTSGSCVPDTTTTPPPPTGIDNVTESSEVTFYPNPFTNELRISNINGKKIDKVRLYDIAGKLFIEQNWNGSDALDVSRLEAGAYFVQLYYKQELVSKALLTKQ